MEAALVDRLRRISASRRQLVELIQTLIPHIQYLEDSSVFHGVCVATTLVLLAALYATTRSMNLFSFHPLCMILACALFFPEGIVAYKNHFLLESLSPIMQHTKRVKVRAIHQTIQLLGVGFLFLGLLFIVAHKFELHLSVLPMSWHSITASTLIIAILIQAFVGQEKLQFHQMYATNRKIRRWHGDMGLLIWDGICLTLLSGLFSFVPFSIYSCLAFVFPFILWLAVILQLIGKNAIKDEEMEMDASGDISASQPQFGGGIAGIGNAGVDSEYGYEDDDNEGDDEDGGLLVAPKRRRSRVNLSSSQQQSDISMEKSSLTDQDDEENLSF